MFDLKQQLAVAAWQKGIIDKFLNSKLLNKYAIKFMIIHDEIVIEIPKEVREEVIKELDKLMEDNNVACSSEWEFKPETNIP